jgi:lipopolysaccharide transport system ATP-binding protein
MPVISVDNVSKRYRMGQFGYRTLREDIYDLSSRLVRFGKRSRRDNGKDFIWALKAVSFEVDQGEKLGIIGPNGSGKTTLLRLLAGITKPTEGKISIKGRLGVLIELMAGFHPELTGRENIYLNGAIMGMSQREVRRKFDEIVSFAELEDFIDTPIKRYSSGMQVRLGFAVAAHLDPEILLVDEVLAVGDASFQKKCLGKMDDVAREGRTVLFVSHSMPSITRLCDRACLLDQGKLVAEGNPHQVIQIYLHSGHGSSAARVWDETRVPSGTGIARLRAVRVHTESSEVAEVVDIRRPVGIDVEYWNLKEGARLVPNLHFYNGEGVCIFISTNNTSEWYNRPHPLGLFRSTCWIPGNFLSEGIIIVTAAVSTINPTEACDVERDAVSFQVEDRSHGDGARGLIATDFPGIVRPLLKWTMEVEPLMPPRLNSK